MASHLLIKRQSMQIFDQCKSDFKPFNSKDDGVFPPHLFISNEKGKIEIKKIVLVIKASR